MTEVVKYIGLDVHETIAVGAADGERGCEVRYVGTAANEDDAVRKLVKRLMAPDTSLILLRGGPLRLWPASVADEAGTELHRHRAIDDAAAAG